MWKTAGGAKPDAVIEAKTSYDPTKGLKALLGEAGDKGRKAAAVQTRRMASASAAAASARAEAAAIQGLSARPTTRSPK